MSCTNSLHDWCLLIRDRRWSAAQKFQLIEHFREPEQILNAPDSERRKRLSGRQVRNQAGVSKRDIQRDLDWLAEPQNHLIHYHHPSYPELLRYIPDPPLALFASGNVSLLNDPGVAIVGSRQPTPVGVQIVKNIAGPLAESGITVISGMALGIDGHAHRAALDVQGSSIAVQGCGMDIVYPARHRSLFHDLEESGLLISEYPLGYPATQYTFPARNRIVSGLARGVVIVEAAERSGTLITARLAVEQNRELMVVPGSALSAQYAGSHRLLQQGAALVMSAEDVVHCIAPELADALAASRTDPEVESNETPGDSDKLLACVKPESTAVDEIILESGLTAAEVSSMLIMLELQGTIARSSDGGYINLR